VGGRPEGDVIVGGAGVFVDGVRFVFDERALILEKTWEHVLLSGAALAVSVLIAVPVGVWLGHVHRGSFLAVNLANVGRALPTLVVIAVGFTLFGIGFTNLVVALVVLGLPPILTNAYVAVDEVDPDAVEAARGMGMTEWQVLRRVEVPLALPLLFAGIRTAALFIIATATIAAVAGGGGLGEILVNQAGYGLDGLVGAALCVSLLAFAADAAIGGLQRVLTPRGLRSKVPAFEPDVSSGVGAAAAP
jgi:osmoprotectant transport system permease protein